VWGYDFPQAYDGAFPGSALLSSAQIPFTPGLMQQDNGSQHFYQTDVLGSVRGVSDNNQNPLGEVYYNAFQLSGYGYINPRGNRQHGSSFATSIPPSVKAALPTTATVQSMLPKTVCPGFGRVDCTQ